MLHSGRSPSICLAAAESVAGIIDCVNNSRPCMGNPDGKYMALLPPRKACFKIVLVCVKPTCLYSLFTSPCVCASNREAIIVAFEDKRTFEFPTIRHSKCELLLPDSNSGSRCEACVKYRKTLRTLSSRHTKESLPHTSADDCHVNYRYMCSPEKEQ